MPTIKIRKPEPKACLWVNGEVDYVGPWPLAQLRKKIKLQNNTNVQLHEARHYFGVDYCKKCGAGIRNPYLFIYEKHDYWHCEDCHQINYIN